MMARIWRGMVLVFSLIVAAGGGLHAQEAVNRGDGAVLRVLDKLNATITDLTIRNGTSLGHRTY